MRLLILNRPGIAVISGIVKTVDLASGEIVVENDCYLPVSQVIERRSCRFSLDRNEMERFRICSGAFVTATVRPTPEMELLAHNGEDDTREYHTIGYHLRYTGSFDFARCGITEEEHVFVGKVTDVGLCRVSGNRICTMASVLWRRRGTEMVRRTFASGNVVDKMKKIKDGIFVTGPRINLSGTDIYKLKQVISKKND